MKQLKPYQVGENDIVAAFNDADAVGIMKNDFGECHYGDLTPEDVEDLSYKLDVMVHDEEGNPIQTLRKYVEECDGIPQYLYGWE